MPCPYPYPSRCAGSMSMRCHSSQLFLCHTNSVQSSILSPRTVLSACVFICSFPSLPPPSPLLQLHASNGSPLPHLQASVSSCQAALTSFSSSVPTVPHSLYLPPGGDSRCIAVRITARDAASASTSSPSPPLPSAGSRSKSKRRGLSDARQLASDGAADAQPSPAPSEGVEAGSPFLLSILPGRHYHPQAGAVRSAASVHLHGLYPFRLQAEDRGAGRVR